MVQMQKIIDKTSRANKKLSTKRIIPVEYFEDISNLEKIESFINYVSVKNFNIGDIIYTIGLNLLKNNSAIAMNNLLVLNFIEKCNFTYKSDLNLNNLPQNENDLLGLIYQCLLTEGTKNIYGSYYTPKNVVKDMVSDVVIDIDKKVLDPCCGSLTYILNMPGIQPENIYAMDKDPIAVMIAKFNYFFKFPEAKVLNVFNEDYLNSNKLLENIKFDYVITNPPWGAVTAETKKYNDILSGEIFSCFLVEAHRSLKKTGQLRFLLPESILNVKLHKDIRYYLLHKTNLLAIKIYSGLFSGVTTKYVAIKADREGDCDQIKIDILDRTWSISKNIYKSNQNYIFRLSNSIDESIISKVLDKKKYDLSNSIWALGIVTGNNKEKLTTVPNKNYEKIYTGKEISPYRLKPSKYYINYDRSQLQQVAKDEIYRTKPKLIYKFISNKLVFAIDETASLFLNSANILIPNIPNMSIKTIAAFLNSELYQYLYMKLFREIKILKSNLLELPFPEIDHQTNEKITKMVDNIISGESDDAVLQNFIYMYFNVTNAEIKSIKSEIYGLSN